MSDHISQLVHQLGGRSKPLAQLKAAKELVTLCRDDESLAALAVAAGAIAPLVKLLGSTSAAIQEHAARALEQLCCGYTVAAAEVGAAGAIPPLVRLLGSRSAAAQDAAATALLRLLRAIDSGVCEENADKIVAAGAIPALLPPLDSHSRTTKQQALMGLCWLSEAYAAQLVAAGAVPALVRLLECAPLEIINVAGALSFLLRSGRDAVAQAVAAGAVPALVELVGCNPRMLSLGALEALSVMLKSDADTVAQAVAAGAIPRLVLLLGPTPKGDSASELRTMEGAEALAALLPVLHNHPDNISSVIAAGAIPALLQLLETDDLVTQQQAMTALASICLSSVDNSAQAAAAMAAGVVPPLVRLLDCSNGLTRRLVLVALSGVCAHHAAEVVAAGVIPPLVLLLGSSDAETKRAAVGLLRVLCFQCPAEAAGAIPAAASASEREQVQLQALHSLRALCCGSQGNPASVAAVPLLVQLLDSPTGSEAETADTAAALLSFICSSDDGAERALAAGVMPPLLQLLGCVEALGQEDAAAAFAALYRTSISSTGGMVPAGSTLALVMQLGGWHERTGGRGGAAAAPGGPSGEPTGKPTNEPAAGPTGQPTGDQCASPAGSASPDTISSLLRLLGCRHREVGDQVAAALAGGMCCSCSRCAGTMAQLVAAGAVPPLLAALQHGFLGQSVPEALIELHNRRLKRVVDALCSFSAASEGQAQLAAAAVGILPALLPLLDCGCGELQHSAALTLANVCSSAAGARAALAMAGAGAVPALERLLGSGSDAERARAEAALRCIRHNAAASPTAEEEVVPERAGATLASLLESNCIDFRDLQQHALAALVHMVSSTNKYLAIIMEA